MAPPELTADAPVADVVGPVEVGLFHAGRDQLDVTVLDAFHSGLNELVHADEPLGLDHGLDSGAAAVMGTHVVGIIFDINEKPHLVQFLDDLGSALVAVHARELAAVGINGGIVVEDVDLGEAVALSHLKVVGVVGRGDLNDTGTEFHINILVGHDGDLSVHEGQEDLFAHQILIAVILGIHGHGGIAQHGLGTGGGKLQETGGGDGAVVLDQGILDMPEVAGLILVLHLCVGNGGLADRAPVDDAAALVDPAFFMHADKDFLNGLGAALVHGEAFSVPVTGRTQLLKLLNDASAVFLSPVPALLQEAFSSQIHLFDALCLQGVDDLDLCGDGRMVGPGLPEGIVALHPLKTDQDILHGVVQGMAHVELAGDVRRGDHDGEGFLGMIHFCVEIFLIFPVFIDSVLNSLRIVGLSEFLAHVLSSCACPEKENPRLLQNSMILISGGFVNSGRIYSYFNSQQIYS